MSGKIEALLQSTGRPRKSVPDVLALFGNLEPFSVFRDMAAVCERSTRDHGLAYPMSIPFPPEPPDPPDFAGLVSLYCNHLGYVLAPAVCGPARKAPAAAGEYISLLAFLVFAARCYSASLPATVNATGYLEKVTTTLLTGMQVTRPDDDLFWRTVASHSRRSFDELLRDEDPAAGRSVDELARYLTSLPAVEASGPGDALGPVYQRGKHLCEILSRRIVLDDGMMTK